MPLVEPAGIFVQKLSGTWPNVSDKIFDGLFQEDSGLMLFSRLLLLRALNAAGFYAKVSE